MVMLFALANQAWAGPVGGMNMTVVAPLGDSIVSVPFVQRTEGVFTVTSVSSNVANISQTLNLNQYSGSLFYVRFTSGIANGRWSTIVSNTANSFTLDDATLLSGVVIGDSFKVLRHHTLSSLFPDAHKGLSFIQSPNAFTRSTEILVIPVGGANGVTPAINGINKSASTTYFFLNGRWNRSNAATNGDNDIILPQSYFIIRNRSAATSLTFTSFGEVEPSAQATRIVIQSIKNDIPGSTGLPVPVRLSQLDLGGSSAFVNSPSSFSRGDELYVFPPNGTTGFNKSASITYYFLNGAWRKSPGSAALNADAELLPAGAAFVFRKSAGAAGTAVIWNAPNPF